MKLERETTTIQCWPSGRSYTYTGDPHGPAQQKRLRAGHYQARFQCPANCRRLYLDLLEPEERAQFEADEATYPGMGKYITPLAEEDGRPWYHGPICETCHGEGYIVNPKRNPWRKGTAAEWREIRIARRAERIGRESIKRCQSSLVGDLIQRASEERDDLARAFEYDQIENLYQDPSDWDADQCREYASDQGVELPEVPTVDCPTCAGNGQGGPNTTPCDPCNATGQIPDPDYEEDDSRGGWLTEARDACRDHAQDHPAEVFEWWLVDPWLCGQLKEIGEVVIDNDYGEWYGRQCSGQALIMDGSLQKIAAKFEREGD